MILKIKVYPNSPKTQISEKAKRADINLAVDIKSPAEDNMANVELIRFLAKYYGLNKTQIEIISGAKSTIKTIRIFD